MPKTKTGPAIINILEPIPIIWPSLLNSIAGETIEFANPVIGTNVPAPAIFAMLSKILRAVKRAPKKTSVTDTQARASLICMPDCVKQYDKISPIVHIAPPKIKAFMQFFTILLFGEALSVILEYSF